MRRPGACALRQAEPTKPPRPNLTVWYRLSMAQSALLLQALRAVVFAWSPILSVEA